MKKELEDKWDETARTGQPVPLNAMVVCDFCNKDFTNSDMKGGFIFESKGVCPECAPKTLADIRKYREEKYIRAKCPLDKSFADFIREYRGPDSYIQVTENLKL